MKTRMSSTQRMMRPKRNVPKSVLIIQLVLLIFFIIGEVKCIKKAIRCDWEEPYKAEIIYTVGACTGLGGIIGYFNIDDTKPEQKQNETTTD